MWPRCGSLYFILTAVLALLSGNLSSADGGKDSEAKSILEHHFARVLELSNIQCTIGLEYRGAPSCVPNPVMRAELNSGCTLLRAYLGGTGRFRVDALRQDDTSIRSVISDGRKVDTGDGQVWSREFLAKRGHPSSFRSIQAQEFKDLLWPYDVVGRHLAQLAHSTNLEAVTYALTITMAPSHTSDDLISIVLKPKLLLRRGMDMEGHFTFDTKHGTLLVTERNLRNGAEDGTSYSYEGPIPLKNGKLWLMTRCCHVFHSKAGTATLESVLDTESIATDVVPAPGVFFVNPDPETVEWREEK